MEERNHSILIKKRGDTGNDLKCCTWIILELYFRCGQQQDYLQYPVAQQGMSMSVMDKVADITDFN